MKGLKEQIKYYSGKKKRYTLISKVVVNKGIKEIIYVTLSNGKMHDFRLFKESRTYIHPTKKAQVVIGNQGILKHRISS